MGSQAIGRAARVRESVPSVWAARRRCEAVVRGGEGAARRRCGSMRITDLAVRGDDDQRGQRGKERQQRGGEGTRYPPARNAGSTEASDPRRGTTPSVGHRARHFPSRGSGGSAASWGKVAPTRCAGQRMPMGYVGGQSGQPCTHWLRALDHRREPAHAHTGARRPPAAPHSHPPARHVGQPARHHHRSACPPRSGLRRDTDAATHLGGAGRPELGQHCTNSEATSRELAHAPCWMSHAMRFAPHAMRFVPDGLRLAHQDAVQ